MISSMLIPSFCIFTLCFIESRMEQHHIGIEGSVMYPLCCVYMNQHATPLTATTTETASLENAIAMATGQERGATALNVASSTAAVMACVLSVCVFVADLTNMWYSTIIMTIFHLSSSRCFVSLPSKICMYMYDALYMENIAKSRIVLHRASRYSGISNSSLFNCQYTVQ